MADRNYSLLVAASPSTTMRRSSVWKPRSDYDEVVKAVNEGDEKIVDAINS